MCLAQTFTISGYVRSKFSGDPIEVMFNPKFFIDTLNVIDDESVFIKITDESKPCLIKGENDNSFLSVIMPMKI